MAYIIGVPTGRISNAFTQSRLLSQVMADQAGLYRTELQLSTGKKYALPSEDPLASLRIMDLQRLLEQKNQVKQNVDLGGSYMSLTDNTLMSVNDLFIEARGIGNANVGTVSSYEEQLAAAAQIAQITSQILDASNTNANGRYLFSGTTSGVSPYESTDTGYIKYLGNNVALSSYSDINTLFQTNSPGSEVFGGVSNAVEGDVDVNPNLLFDTRLSDLNGGEGVTLGSFQISNGTNSSVIDISNCATIGDVAQQINAYPPDGTTTQVEITSEGLRLCLVPDAGFPGTNLKITEIASGTTAAELGILQENPIGTNWLDGDDLDPILRSTTSLSQALGTYAQNIFHSSNTTGNLIFTADAIGPTSNGIQIAIENTAPLAGSETAVWDPTARTLTIGILEGRSTALQVIQAVNASGAPLSASTDPIEGPDAGTGTVSVTDPLAPLALAGGTGEAFDKTGLQIVNNGETYSIGLTAANSFQDVLNILNASEAGVRAAINEDATGIDLHTVVSGCDFMVGENGGETATQLGLRTFDESVYLAELNFGFGVEIREDVDDFTVTLADGTVLDIDLAHKVDATGQPLPGDQPAQTIEDVLYMINHHEDNVMHDASGNPVTDAFGNLVRKVIAGMPSVGNGIELEDRTSGAGGTTITKNILSSAAWQLGLLTEGEDTFTVDSSTALGHGAVEPPSVAGNNELYFTATQPGYYGDFTITYELLPSPPVGPPVLPYVDFDLADREMTFYVDRETGGLPPATTADDVRALLAADPDASLYFTATNYGTSTGAEAIYPVGLTPAQQAEWVNDRFSAQTTGGASVAYAGTDVNPQEAEGVFDALIRLQKSLETGDVLGTQHALERLEEAFTQFTFGHADLGAREQGLDVVNSRLQTENVELNTLLSLEADADYAEVASNLMSQQAAYQASLKAMSTNFAMSLLDYI